MTRRVQFGLALSLIVAGLFAWQQTGQSAQPRSGVMTAVKVDKAPVLDGKVDELWKKAGEIKVAVTGGANLPK